MRVVRLKTLLREAHLMLSETQRGKKKLRRRMVRMGRKMTMMKTMSLTWTMTRQ